MGQRPARTAARRSSRPTPAAPGCPAVISFRPSGLNATSDGRPLAWASENRGPAGLQRPATAAARRRSRPPGRPRGAASDDRRHRRDPRRPVVRPVCRRQTYTPSAVAAATTDPSSFTASADAADGPARARTRRRRAVRSPAAGSPSRHTFTWLSTFSATASTWPSALRPRPPSGARTSSSTPPPSGPAKFHCRTAPSCPPLMTDSPSGPNATARIARTDGSGARPRVLLRPEHGPLLQARHVPHPDRAVAARRWPAACRPGRTTGRRRPARCAREAGRPCGRSAGGRAG